MAKLKKGSTATDEGKEVSFIVRLPRKIHTELKLLSVNTRIPMNDLAKQAITEMITARKK